MAFKLGSLATAVSAVAGVVPGGQAVALAAGKMGAQLRDDEGVFYLSPLMDPSVAKPERMLHMPAALVPIGPPQGRVVRIRGESALTSIASTVPSALHPLGTIDWPQIPWPWTKRRSLDACQRELALIAVARELEIEGIEPGWAAWIQKYGLTSKGWFDQRLGGAATGPVAVRAREVLAAAPNRGFDVKFPQARGGMAQLVNVEGQLGRLHEWWSLAGTRLGSALTELLEVAPLVEDLRERAMARLQLEADASAELVALYEEAMRRVRGELDKLDPSDPTAFDRLLESIRASLSAHVAPSSAPASGSPRAGAFSSPIDPAPLAPHGDRSMSNESPGVVGCGLALLGAIGLSLLALR